MAELCWVKVITQAWSPSSTYQQLLTVWWVPQQLLQKAVFDTFTFEGGWGTKNPFLGQTPFVWPKIFWTQNFLGLTIFFDPQFILHLKDFSPKFFELKILLQTHNCFKPKIFWGPQNFFLTKIFFKSKLFCTQYFFGLPLKTRDKDFQKWTL